jgi:hypothetical protein
VRAATEGDKTVLEGDGSAAERCGAAWARP